MGSPMLTLDPGSRLPPLELAPGIALARGRAHEVTGAARRTFALLAGAALWGPILWLQPRWEFERPMGDGIARFVEPGRMIFARCRSAIEILWCAEETLRSGAVPLVIAELPLAPALTPVRRLHLAAEAGAEAAGATARGRGEAAPLCLLLTPDGSTAPGVETRWRFTPVPGWTIDGSARWRLERLRARMAPPGAWTMRCENARLVPDGDATASGKPGPRTNPPTQPSGPQAGDRFDVAPRPRGGGEATPRRPFPHP